MAVPSNTIQAVARIGVREDLSDRIAELFPDECPFQQAIGKEKQTQVYHEWQTDGLVAANANNYTVQGDDLANENRPNTVRVGTYSQIMKKIVSSSTTMEASTTAGRKSELAREIMKAGKELRTDAEKRFSGNYAAVAPTTSVEGQTAGALAWLRTNPLRGAGGAAPTLSGTTSGFPNAAATNGTTRAYTEALLKQQLATIWAAGGSPDIVITSVTQKQVAAAFGGLADSRRETGDKKITIVAGADIYVSDVGRVEFVPSRFCSTRDALIIDPEYWAVAELDPMKMIDLAKTGLATRKAMYQEVSLVCRNEAASGAIADIA